MYVRTQEEALDALAQILSLPDPREQLVQSTVKIMLCLEVEPRQLLADCQVLLLEGGLETLRLRRREAWVGSGGLSTRGVDPREEVLFDDIGLALDALRLALTVRQVFPDLRYERWQIARALLGAEGALRQAIAGAVRTRGNPTERAEHRQAAEEAILSLHRVWMDRVGAIRTACLDTLKINAPVDVEQLHEEADLVFALFATSDERVVALLDAVDRDPAEAARQIMKVYELEVAARHLDDGPPGPGESGDSRQVA